MVLNQFKLKEIGIGKKMAFKLLLQISGFNGTFQASVTLFIG